jgi:3-methyladenine DNA glycosylase AlkC
MYVETYGLLLPEISLELLRIFGTADSTTAREGSQIALRTFVRKNPDEIINKIYPWIESEDERQRRLVVESSRPRGVWTSHLDMFKTNPEILIPILEKLRSDESLYVRKSVANALNDISKDHPQLVLSLAKSWMNDKNAHTQWVVKRACRTLLRNGYEEAYEIVGYSPTLEVLIIDFHITPSSMKLADYLEINLSIYGCKSGKIQVDYYLASLDTKSRYINHLKSCTIKRGETILLEKKHQIDHAKMDCINLESFQIIIVVNGKEVLAARDQFLGS